MLGILFRHVLLELGFILTHKIDGEVFQSVRFFHVIFSFCDIVGLRIYCCSGISDGILQLEIGQILDF